MKLIKGILYALIVVLLVYILYKTIQRLLSLENFNEQTITTEVTNGDEIDKADEIEIIEPTDATDVEIDDNEVVINDTDFKDIEEGEYITTQGDVIVPEEVILSKDASVTNEEPETNGSYKTQIESSQKDIVIKPKYYDGRSRTVFDGVKVMKTKLLSPWAQPYMLRYKNNYMLDIGEDDFDGGSMRFTKKSPACCSPTYPPPFKTTIDPSICKNKGSYVSGPYTGNDNWSNAGCACVTKKNMKKLAKRGGNA